MVHSQLPVLSLLCLCWALLLLPPVLTLEEPKKFCVVTLKDPGLQEALAFAMPQYNQKRTQDVNYYKMQRVKAQSMVYTKVERSVKYHLKVEIVKTSCKKTSSHTMTYQEIQHCKTLPGNPQKELCNIKVTSQPVQHNMSMKIVSCS